MPAESAAPLRAVGGRRRVTCVGAHSAVEPVSAKPPKAALTGSRQKSRLSPEAPSRRSSPMSAETATGGFSQVNERTHDQI
jgi:hypothetical protein